MLPKLLAPPGLFAVAALAALLAGGPARADVFELGANGAFARVDRHAPALNAPALNAPALDAPALNASAAQAPVATETAVSLRAMAGPARAHTILAAIAVLARRNRLDPALVEAVAWAESRLHPDAVSAKGAVGVMQLMPATAAQMGIDAHDWRTNVAGGTALLARLLRRYDNDLVKALAAYNAGTAAVDRYHGVPPWRETRAYVAAILDRLAVRAMQDTTSGQNG